MDYQCLTKVEITKETPILDPNTGKTIYFDPTNNTVKNEPTTFIIDTKKEIEYQILKRNKKHFAQAKNTPWHKHPLSAISSTNNFNLFHANDKPIEMPPGTFRETQTILDILREESSKEHQKLNAEITFDKFI